MPKKPYGIRVFRVVRGCQITLMPQRLLGAKTLYGIRGIGVVSMARDHGPHRAGLRDGHVGSPPLPGCLTTQVRTIPRGRVRAVTYRGVGRLRAMTRTYAHCRICHRPKSQVKLSARGKCHACALGNVMAAAAAGVAAMEMAHEPAGLKQAGQTMFESLNERRST